MMYKLFDEQIHVHQQNIDYDSEDSTDIVEAYLKEMKKREHEPDFGGFEWVLGVRYGFTLFFRLVQLKSICFDLWVSLKFLLIFLAGGKIIKTRWFLFIQSNHRLSLDRWNGDNL